MGLLSGCGSKVSPFLSGLCVFEFAGVEALDIEETSGGESHGFFCTCGSFCCSS